MKGRCRPWTVPEALSKCLAAVVVANPESGTRLLEAIQGILACVGAGDSEREREREAQ
jgi:hypothetical protein